MKRNKKNLRPFFLALRKLGFTKTYDSRAGGIRFVAFEKPEGDRKFDVQLWGNGGHRASHFLRGCMSTLPTDFTTVPGMIKAIEIERTRQDHKPLWDFPPKTPIMLLF